MAVPSAAAQDPFVGRIAERAALGSAMHAAASGRGGVALITGEAGMGKTRLARELAEEVAAHGCLVLRGACYEGDWMPPYGPWVEALTGCAALAGLDRLRDALGPSWPFIADLVPALGDGAIHRPAESGFAEGERDRLYDAVGRFLLAVAHDRPLLLILDDLHWAGRDTVSLLMYVAWLTARAPLLALCLFRDEEVDSSHPITPLLASLSRNAAPLHLRLGGLAPEDVAHYLHATVGDAVQPALAQALHGDTGGIPFFLREVIAHLVEEGVPLQQGAGSTEPFRAAGIGVPEGVRQVLGRRLARFSPETLTMLRALSIFPSGTSRRVLTVLTGLPELAALDGLDEALRAGIVRAEARGGEAYSVAHAIVRHALYDELSAGRRIRLHRRAARVLAELYGSESDAHVAELAYHAMLAAPGGDAEQAARYCMQAGSRALTLLAYDEAVQWHTRALALLDASGTAPAEIRCDYLLTLGQAQWLAAAAHSAQETFLAAAAEARACDRADLLARAALGLGLHYQPSEVEDRLVMLLKEALRTIGEDDSVLRARLLARLAQALTWAAAREERLALSQDAIAMARRLGDPAVVAGTLMSSHLARWGPENVADRIASGSELLRLGGVLQSREVMLAGHSHRLTALLELGDVAGVDREIAAFTGLAEELRFPPRLWSAALLKAMRVLLAGRLDEAEELARAALHVGRQLQDTSAVLQYYGLQLYALRFDQGRIGELAPAIGELAARYPHVPAYRSGLLLIHVELDQRDEARRLFDALAAHDFTDIPRDLSWMITVTMLAQASASLEDQGRAARLYALLLPFAGQCVVSADVAACYGSVSRSLGLLAATLGRWDAATRHFEDAITQHSRMEAPTWLARTRLDYAAALLRRVIPAAEAPGETERQRALARALLSAARETAGSLGMAGVAARARALEGTLAGSGARSVREPPRYPDGLTGREVDVLALIAAGSSTRAIAERLVLSPATVERHITNLYAKIGARGRADATAYAIRHRLIGGQRPDRTV